ncbi:putative myelin transcription factor 1-like [Scophthalmus maximus]|uniref:Putative myelin transcription factor 1-like n=1 Tax=Scophthalmus maximus TaxID=52904 RepID=A0A2U9C0D1_SCOMX|nr:putative myelin transcription factor 1-like [Scophthalmus maximus]
MSEKEITAAPHLSSPPPASNELQLTNPRHMVMYSRDLHLKVNRSSIAVLTCSDCDQAMKDYMHLL